MMNSINKFLAFIDENWTGIVIAAGLILGLYEKIKAFINTSKEEKINSAKEQLKEIILKLVSDAEEDYDEYNKAGELKRAQVLTLVYEKYPILSKVVSQDELVQWIDEQINAALETLRDVLAENEDGAEE